MHTCEFGFHEIQAFCHCSLELNFSLAAVARLAAQGPLEILVLLVLLQLVFVVMLRWRSHLNMASKAKSKKKLAAG